MTSPPSIATGHNSGESSKERKIRKEREQRAEESNSLSDYAQFYGMERIVVVQPKVSVVEER